MSTSPNAKQRRGLQWIYLAANADFQVACDERRTGQFSGTTSREVAEALEWLSAVAFGGAKRRTVLVFEGEEHELETAGGAQ